MRIVIFILAFFSAFLISGFCLGQDQSLDSLNKKLEKLEKQLEEEQAEREKLKREVEVQKKAAEKYRQDYEEGLKTPRQRRKERRADKVRPYRPDLFMEIPDSLKRDETIAFFKTGRNRVFQGIEIGASGFGYGDLFSFNVPDGQRGLELNNATSVHWAINPVEMDVRIIGEYFKFSTGLGYSVKNFSLANNYMLSIDDDIVNAVRLDEPDFSRNRFRTGYLNVPLLFHFNTSSRPSNSISFAFGAVTGIRLFETYRLKYVDDGQRVRHNTSRNWNTNQFNVDARAGIAYGGFQLFATHSIVPIFRKNYGPELYPFTIGLSLNTSFDK